MLKRLFTSFVVFATGFASFGQVFAINSPTDAQIFTTSSVKNEAQNSVEKDILGMQQDGVAAIRELLNKYAKKDLKETGNMKWSFSVEADEQKTSVGVEFDSYTSIVSYLRGEQEFGAKGTIKIDTSGKKYDFSGTGGMDENGDLTYPKIDATLSATIKFDANVKIVNGDAYFTIADFSVERTGTKDEIESLDTGIAEIKKYIGKTYMVPMNEAGIDDPMAVYKNIEAVLSVLEKNSLFEVKSTIGNVSTLKLKRSTLQALNVALGRKKNAKISDLPMESTLSKLTYRKTTTGGILRFQDKKNQKNNIQIEKSNGEYVLTAQNSEQVKKYRTKSEMNLKMSRNYFGLVSTDATAYSKTNVNILWSNGQLNAKVATAPITSGRYTSIAAATTNTFEISGPLDIWTGSMDVKVKNNGTEYGAITIVSNPDTGYTFKVNANFDFFAKVNITGEGAASFERGEFPVTLPTEFEVVK